MVLRDELNVYLNELLQVNLFRDYCPNGLQVQGKNEIKKIISGVTACQALLDAASKREGDAVLVHHGYFWKGESSPIVGMKQKRIKTILQHDMNLFAYHLPLDGHVQFGNNVQLAKLLGVTVLGDIDVGAGPNVCLQGEVANGVSATGFCALLEDKLQRDVLHIDVDKPIKKIAWATGAAQDFIETVASAGCDAFISGEISERTTHMARELGIHYFAAGHHATERYGVQALGAHLAEKFGVVHEFVDVANPFEKNSYLPLGLVYIANTHKYIPVAQARRSPRWRSGSLPRRFAM